jgi:hypothetical protein
MRDDREELTYSRRRDFLYMLGATVLVFKQEYQGGDAVQEIIYQGQGRSCVEWGPCLGDR